MNSAEAHALKCELAGEVLRSFGSLRFAATGWSMLPTVWPGDTLVVERVSQDEVRIGDVVLVGREGRLCAHRVVSQAEDHGNPRWITQGDAMPAPDRPVMENELLGRVAYLIRAGKLVAVPAGLSTVQSLIAQVVRRSVPAARVLVYLRHMIRTPEKSAPESAPKESVLTCQG
jgi:signal peptidase I